MTISEQPHLACLDSLDQQWNLAQVAHGVELLVSNLDGTTVENTEAGKGRGRAARIGVCERGRRAEEDRGRIGDLKICHENHDAAQQFDSLQMIH